jgi:hypothetical protein
MYTPLTDRQLRRAHELVTMIEDLSRLALEIALKDLGAPTDNGKMLVALVAAYDALTAAQGDSWRAEIERRLETLESVPVARPPAPTSEAPTDEPTRAQLELICDWLNEAHRSGFHEWSSLAVAIREMYRAFIRNRPPTTGG